MNTSVDGGRQRFLVGAVKIPYAARDVAHSVLIEDDDRNFLDMLGADRPDDDPEHPVGSKVMYAVDLTEREVARFRAASNALFVTPDTMSFLTPPVVPLTDHAPEPGGGMLQW